MPLNIQHLIVKMRPEVSFWNQRASGRHYHCIVPISPNQTTNKNLYLWGWSRPGFVASSVVFSQPLSNNWIRDHCLKQGFYISMWGTKPFIDVSPAWKQIGHHDPLICRTVLTRQQLTFSGSTWGSSFCSSVLSSFISEENRWKTNLCQEFFTNFVD